MDTLDRTIDLNCDLGEGFGTWRLTDDEALLNVVTSANIACGFHAGDPSIMRQVCEWAAKREVAIGAHVGYRDLGGFGRRRIEVDPDELADDVLYQIGALDAFARTAGTRVRYVKPHGALYNTATVDPTQARAVVAGVRRYQQDLPVLGLPGSVLLDAAAEAGLPAVAEAFADRAYTATGTLVGRDEPGAVLDDADAVVDRCVAMVTTGAVGTVNGGPVRVDARSICVHGDTPDAVLLAERIRAGLTRAGVRLAPFTAPGGGAS